VQRGFLTFGQVTQVPTEPFVGNREDVVQVDDRDVMQPIGFIDLDLGGDAMDRGGDGRHGDRRQPSAGATAGQHDRRP